MEATKLIEKLHTFIGNNKVFPTNLCSLKHDLVHASLSIGTSLEDEMLVFCLQRGRLIGETQLGKYTADFCRFNKLENNLDYSQLAQRYKALAPHVPPASLVDEVAKLLNIYVDCCIDDED